MNRIKILFFISFFLFTSCSTEKEKTSDIMTPLVGTDPCFGYVELIREPSDIETYRNLGDSILLKDSEPARDEYRTYIGIIAAMIKKNDTIPDIRQAVLTACRTLKSEQKN